MRSPTLDFEYVYVRISLMRPHSHVVGQTKDFLRSVFSSIYHGETKCTETLISTTPMFAPFGPNLTLRKIAIWMSKNCPKLDIFFNGNFVEKMTILSIFLKKIASCGQFFDIQLAIFRGVRSEYRAPYLCLYTRKRW